MIRHIVLANVLMAVILLGGFFAAISMLREVFPSVTLDIISVTVAPITMPAS